MVVSAELVEDDSYKCSRAPFHVHHVLLIGEKSSRTCMT